jgi:integrase
MKPIETANNELGGSKRQSHGFQFIKVLDGRKQPIRGLWVRNGRFYARLNIENTTTGIKKTRRVPLEDKDGNAVQTVPQAVAELKRLQTHRADNVLPELRRTPKFGDYADRYLSFIKSGVGTKKPGTIQKEESHLNLWRKHIEGIRLDRIKRVHVNAFIEARLKTGVSGRTVNLDVISLRNVMKRAIDDGWIQLLPTHGLRPLKVKTPRRALVTHADLERLCAAAFGTKQNKKGGQVPVSKNAQEFVDYIRFMAYSGARRNEALAVRWADVDFERDQLTIGATGDTKNQKARTVDFNPMLKAHLLDMATRLAPDSQWLFPSPQRGEKDIPVKSLKESLLLARARANMPDFNFHDCRHYFISYAVMSGIDYMTIASWVGHQDGGVLIGKVYGHLADAHKKEQSEEKEV